MTIGLQNSFTTSAHNTKNMMRKLFLLVLLFSYTMAADYTNKSHPKPWRVMYYPKNTEFKKADLIDRGCTVFIDQCPKQYKTQMVCGRHYNGHFKTFNNYCDLEYENCNSWRQWSMIKQSRC